MKVNYEVLNKLLLGLLETDDISLKCKQEIPQFVETQDINVFSEECLKEISGIFMLSIKPAYEAIVGDFIPNIFVREENYGNEVE